MQEQKRVVIIGNGIAGITAARHIRKQSDCEILVISGESDYFFSRTALMYVYMGHMEFEHTQPYENWFWEKNRIELLKGWVRKIDFESKTLHIDEDKTLPYDTLVIATGSVPNKFGWPGQDAVGVSGLYHAQDLGYIEQHTREAKHAVVVGGGLIGVELAEMLHSRNISVTFLVRENNFWDTVMPEEEAKMINQEILDHHIDLRLETELKEITTDGEGKVTGVITSTGENIACQFVGLTVGVSPNVNWLKDSGLEINRGVLVNEYLETNKPDVYAIGDCAERRTPTEGRRPLEQVWYTGRMMGEVVARTITGDRTAYRPGIWFNSAKFFNIEYQTYGRVKPQLKSGQEQFFWQSKDQKKSLRIVFDEQTMAVLGVNVLGIRMRHEIWDQWIAAGRKINQVMAELESANFDPEFFKAYEYDIRQVFNREFEYMTVPNKKASLLKRLFA
ncbi:NAD(P)/FAD-dependent oxidoreductase [Reichenbachiella carrageenanivorans]|uniref:NAD(P)/FAD-dependent oxidoreductase n=1 Tax=Reichenbachiella carrageenanivorans TaxID=2979869 RepID=A0ABY6CVU2_9BACT|nr:FAD/NAD(P)-binding oxidoreductase [Reichenbachiella carrageenanivorans]UXX78031.1 NAD(P)/FAD-dependent oxidoreductase [Reichenbachiella carrageenanivorans]